MILILYRVTSDHDMEAGKPMVIPDHDHDMEAGTLEYPSL